METVRREEMCPEIDDTPLWSCPIQYFLQADVETLQILGCTQNAKKGSQARQGVGFLDIGREDRVFKGKDSLRRFDEGVFA